jgi:hypothetical protein
MADVCKPIQDLIDMLDAQLELLEEFKNEVPLSVLRIIKKQISALNRRHAQAVRDLAACRRLHQ